VVLAGAIFLALFVVPAPWGVVLVVGALVVEVGETAFWIWLSKRRKPQVGAEAIVGATVVVVTPCHPIGSVRLNGELWRARCEAGARQGDAVRVLAVEGLTLVVEPA
jgi:membrane protein implicated in regulation of membrane protease activity